MVWLPANYDGSCTNQSAPLTLVCFLIQYFGSSNDEILKDIYGDQSVNDTDYDFIVVGAGAAGCVVANRLSEEPNWKVLLLEAGDEEPLLAQVPGLYSYMINSNANYAYNVTDMPSRRFNRGRVMGGSTAINGMVYSRGSAADYDDWAREGNKGWSWNDVLLYFKKSENARDPEILANYSKYHGTGGLLTIEKFPEEDENTQTILNAFIETGMIDTDVNKGDPTGVSRSRFISIHGTRMSTNGAFIRPFRGKRTNLVVRPNARVTRIIVNSVTKRATGVEYKMKNSNGTSTVQVSVKKEVIISAGVIESPKILMLSGIGPKNDLEQLNITVIQDLPVGLNLQDQVRTPLSLISNNTLFKQSDEEIKSDILEWMNTHEGEQSRRSDVTIQAWYQTKFENETAKPDIQYVTWGGTQADGTLGNMTLNVMSLTPKSTGTVKLNKADPINNQPNITFNFFADPQDVEVIVEGLKFARQIANTQALKNAGLRLSTVSVAGCEGFDIDSDDYLRCLIKTTGTFNLHAVGTCKMGPVTDKSAVVDSSLKVIGIGGLRVIDSSIMPQVTRGNTMAPTIMIGEKGSDMIKKDYM